jgi:hypothetical protein
MLPAYVAHAVYVFGLHLHMRARPRAHGPAPCEPPDMCSTRVHVLLHVPVWFGGCRPTWVTSGNPETKPLNMIAVPNTLVRVVCLHAVCNS